MRRVVLACDDARQRALMRLGLAMSDDFDVVGVAVDAADVTAVVRRCQPDVVVVAFAGVPRLDVAYRVQSECPGPEIVTLATDASVRPAPFVSELRERLMGGVAVL